MLDDIQRHKSVPRPSALPNTPTANAAETVPPKPWLSRHKKTVIIASLLVILAGGGGTGAWFLTHQPAPHKLAVKTAAPTPSPSPSPTPLTKASPLTGVQVDPALADRPIVGVMIENHPDARPQSGLSQAGVVYEANAEGGITRFLALFLDQRPSTLGPVRSLRPYYADWVMEFNAPIAHAGGNADALDMVSSLGIKDLNALTSASSGFYRTTDRYAPHNLYTTADRLDALLKRFGFYTPSHFNVSPRKADTPMTTPSHPNIHIDFSYSGFQVDYKYDASTNDYARYLAGAPHIDRTTGKQIHVKNVVVEMMPTSYGRSRIGEQEVFMTTVGRGQGWVFRDGDATPITWSKASHNDRTQLLDSSGNDVPLDAGNTWYAIVPQGKAVTF